jgi:hypothetical protein
MDHYTLKLLEEVGKDSARTHKISVLQKYQTNELLKKVLFLALDPYTQFYIRKIPKYKSKEIKHDLTSALRELEKLSSRELTGNAAIQHLTEILSTVHPDDAIVIERIIGKDLRCGAADATVNTVFENLIPTYPCLLARPYDQKNIKNIVFPAYSQLKADGVRANMLIEGKKVTVCGRSGKVMDLLGYLDSHGLGLGTAAGMNCAIDGELVLVDKDGKILDRKTGNGIINKAIKGTISHEEAAQVRFQVWDIIPLDEFRKGLSSKNYAKRFEALQETLSKNTTDVHLSWIIEHRTVRSLEEAEAHFQYLLSRGEEGTILKNFEGLWEDARSKHLVKMKAEKDADLEIIDWNPGTGKFEGQVGSLVCASSDRKVVVAISGFSDELRLWITENIAQLMGKIVTVLYNERIASKDKNREGVDSLFLPRFVEFRNDKTVANSNEEIK